MAMAAELIQVNGIEVPVETIGDAAAPAVLLVAGTGCSLDFWREDLCAALVAGGARVVRYDQRDTGMAPADPPGSPAYGLPDLLDDAIGVLDALGIASAHWVGFSQGGWVAQLAAIREPQRVASLALVSTRPTGHGPNDADLPEPGERLLAAFAEDAPPPDPADREAWIEYLVAGERPLASTRVPFEEDDAREHAARVATRTRDLLALISNHQLAPQGPPWRAHLDRIGVPTTVVHGADDPLFPLANGCALAREIPGAELRVLPDVGHELPRRARPLVARAILATVARARRPISLAASAVLGVEHLVTIAGAEPRPSAIQGVGLFATAGFAGGETLGGLDGQEVDPGEHPAVVEALEWNALAPDRLLVRALRTSYGLINHSPDPNVEVAGDGRALVARRDIAPEEELTLDYFDQPLPERYLAGPEAARLRGTASSAPSIRR
jgi:pimeloyl-ACP methyl ester carboxylesterase